MFDTAPLVAANAGLAGSRALNTKTREHLEIECNQQERRPHLAVTRTRQWRRSRGGMVRGVYYRSYNQRTDGEKLCVTAKYFQASYSILGIFPFLIMGRWNGRMSNGPMNPPCPKVARIVDFSDFTIGSMWHNECLDCPRELNHFYVLK